MIDWPAFTPLSAFAGGLLIGVATALLLLLNGRIAGISGILGELLHPKRNDIAWRLLFIAGLIISPLVYQLFHVLPDATITANTGTIVIAGLLVGIGTRYAAGCTSGHGICGISRLSPRSIVATLVFMLSAGITVFIARHIQ